MAGGSKLGIRRGLIVIMGVLVVATVMSACGPFRLAGQRCTVAERDAWAHDNTHLLRCINGRWKKSVTIKQADAFWAAVKAKKDAENAPPPPPPPSIIHPSTPAIGSQRSTIAAGDSHTCAVRGGLVRCWGSDSTGQLGTSGPDQSSLTPVTASGITNAVSVTASGLSTCAVLADGTAKCWGSNLNGQLGIGHLGSEAGYSSISTPTAVVGLTGVVQVEMGPASTCGLRNDGTVWCWGIPDAGRLGNNSTNNPAVTDFLPNDPTNYDSYPTPQGVAGLTGVVSITVGSSHACGLRGDGTVWCWGSNGAGQLGNGAGGPGSDPGAKLVAFPVPMRAFSASITFSGARGISASAASTCAMDSAGQALCVGDNSLGLLGFGSGNPILPGFTNVILQAAATVIGATSLSSGGLFNCAPMNTGYVKCWGRNDAGQLGIPYGFSYVAPQTVQGITSAVEVAGGAQHACGLRSDNIVFCWGFNGRGQLGDGTTTSHYIAAPVVGL